MSDLSTNLDLRTVLEAVQATVQRALAIAPIPQYAPAVITGIDASGFLATVVVDGADETTIGAQVLYSGGLFPGDRVEVVFVAPHGCFVVGRRGGDFDPWHRVGEPGEPAFGTDWINSPATGELDTDTFSKTMFRRHGRIVELRGAAKRTGGANPVIFTVPDNYRPRNDLFFPAVVGPLVQAGFVGVQRSGEVHHMGGGDPNHADGYVSITGIFYSVDPPFAP